MTQENPLIVEVARRLGTVGYVRGKCSPPRQDVGEVWVRGNHGLFRGNVQLVFLKYAENVDGRYYEKYLQEISKYASDNCVETGGFFDLFRNILPNFFRGWYKIHIIPVLFTERISPETRDWINTYSMLWQDQGAGSMTVKGTYFIYSYPVIVTTEDAVVHYDQLTDTKSAGLFQKYFINTIEKVIIPAVGGGVEVNERGIGKIKTSPQYIKKKREYAKNMLTAGVGEIIAGFVILYFQVLLDTSLPLSYALMGLGILTMGVGVIGIIETRKG